MRCTGGHRVGGGHVGVCTFGDAANGIGIAALGQCEVAAVGAASRGQCRGGGAQSLDVLLQGLTLVDHGADLILPGGGSLFSGGFEVLLLEHLSHQGAGGVVGGVSQGDAAVCLLSGQ